MTAVLVMFSGCTVDLIKGDVLCVDMLLIGLGISLSTNVVATSLLVSMRQAYPPCSLNRCFH